MGDREGVTQLPDEMMRVVADALWRHDADVNGYEYEGLDELPDWSQGIYEARAQAALGAVLGFTDSMEWCETHTSNGRGPSPFGEACHYAALRMVSGLNRDLKSCSFVARIVVARRTEEEGT